MYESKELELFVDKYIENLKELREKAFLDNNSMLYYRYNIIILALEGYDSVKKKIRHIDLIHSYGFVELRRTREVN